MPGTWTRFFVGNRLEVAGGDGLAVVPSDFEGTETHRAQSAQQNVGNLLWSVNKTMYTSSIE